MDAFDKLVAKHFPQAGPLQMLMEMVEKELGGFRPKERKILREAIQTLTMEHIPDIPISEIGWSAVGTPEKGGKEVPSAQRQQLQNFLDNILPQGDLQDKLISLAAFYEGTSLDMITGETHGQTISKALSYLTFYKTLTKVITNFNASSAGFSFESFLGVMLGGKQIPPNSGTIADLDTPDGLSISLKLYAESGVEVGGSYTDLVGDLTGERHPMQYVVCMKDLESAGTLEANGSIKWYRFNFTLDNVMDILIKSKEESQKCIIIPEEVARQIDAGYADIDLEKTLPSVETLPEPMEMEKVWAKIFISKFEEIKDIVAPITAQEVIRVIDYANNEGIFKPLERGDRFIVIRGLSSMPMRPLKALLKSKLVPDAKSSTDPILMAMSRAVWSANEELVKQYTAKKLKAARSAAIKKMKFLSIEESRNFYNSLKDPTLKAVALKNSLGYLNTYQFSLNRGNVYKIADYSANVLPSGQGEVKIGEINIGTTAIEKMLKQVSQVIDDSIFEIFNSLKELTMNIQAYFAGGLREDKQADTAIKAANNIETKTEEIKPGKK
tara:strand:+ start:264 stop:1925 length:1662 start_codon:yes stop_codon:yes gene_type:complete